MADTEVDLGYQGEWSGMDCAEIPIIDERLQCNYAKWEYDDPLAKSDVKRKTLNRRRKNKHAFAIRTLCSEEDPFLCKDVDRDGEPSDKNFMCVKLAACPERGARLQDIPDDVKEFFKLIAELFNFNRFKSKKRKKGSSAKAKSVLEKLKMRQKEIKEKFNELPSVKGAKGAKGGKDDKGAKGAKDEKKGGGAGLSKRKQQSVGTGDRILRGITGGLKGTGGICSYTLKKSKFNDVWKWYEREIGHAKDSLGEMKGKNLGEKHKQKEQCFATAPDGAQKKKFLEEYYKITKQKLKLSRGPKAFMKRVNRKMKKGISKANMKMDKTIKNGKRKFSIGSCVKEPGTKICKRDADGQKIYKPGRTPISNMFSTRRSRIKKELRNDPLKVAARREEKTKLRKELKSAKNIRYDKLTGMRKIGARVYRSLNNKTRTKKVLKTLGHVTTLGSLLAASKARRGIMGKHKQTEQVERLRKKTESFKKSAQTALERNSLKNTIKDAKNKRYQGLSTKKKLVARAYRSLNNKPKLKTALKGLTVAPALYSGVKEAYKMVTPKRQMRLLREKAAYGATRDARKTMKKEVRDLKKNAIKKSNSWTKGIGKYFPDSFYRSNMGSNEQIRQAQNEYQNTLKNTQNQMSKDTQKEFEKLMEQNTVPENTAPTENTQPLINGTTTEAEA